MFSKVPQFIFFIYENVFKDLSICKDIYFAGIFINQPKYSKHNKRLIYKCPQWGCKKDLNKSLNCSRLEVRQEEAESRLLE